jgi:beta-ketoacyl ACP synthase
MNAVAELSTGNGLPDVVVTGVAMTTALATDVEATWKGLLDGQSGIRWLEDEFIDQFALPVRVGGHLLEDFDEQLTRVELRRFLFLQKISTIVGRRVWANAGSPEVDTNRLMVSIGTGMGSTEEFVWAYDDICELGIKTFSPLACQSRDHHPGVGLRLRCRGHRPGVAQPRAR